MNLDPQYQKYVFVCENKREAGRPACGEAGSRLLELLREVAKAEQLGGKVRICRSGCLDMCEKGPAVLVEPDHLMFERVEDTDIPKILASLQAPASGV